MGAIEQIREMVNDWPHETKMRPSKDYGPEQGRVYKDGYNVPICTTCHKCQISPLVVQLEQERAALVEALQDLVNNESCSCRSFYAKKQLDEKCPRCKLAVEEAFAALRSAGEPAKEGQ